MMSHGFLWLFVPALKSSKTESFSWNAKRLYQTMWLLMPSWKASLLPNLPVWVGKSECHKPVSGLSPSPEPSKSAEHEGRISPWQSVFWRKGCFSKVPILRRNHDLKTWGSWWFVMVFGALRVLIFGGMSAKLSKTPCSLLGLQPSLPLADGFEPLAGRTEFNGSLYSVLCINLPLYDWETETYHP